MSRGSIASALPLLCALACLPELNRSKAELRAAAPGEQSVMMITAPLRVGAEQGWKETLPVGSTWRRVGSIERGDVYKRTGGVFMLTSRNAHEAYLVVAGGRLVGFYLPGEATFAPADHEVALPAPGEGGHT